MLAKTSYSDDFSCSQTLLQGVAKVTHIGCPNNYYNPQFSYQSILIKKFLKAHLALLCSKPSITHTFTLLSIRLPVTLVSRNPLTTTTKRTRAHCLWPSCRGQTDRLSLSGCTMFMRRHLDDWTGCKSDQLVRALAGINNVRSGRETPIENVTLVFRGVGRGGKAVNIRTCNGVAATAGGRAWWT